MRKRGFTLLEVLVAISICCLLAAILFPVFASAKAKGNEQACKSNLHQLYVGIYLYRSENDGDGKYGGALEMGLPLDIVSFMKTSRLSMDLLKCRGRKGGVVPGVAVYSIYFNPVPSGGNDDWGAYSKLAKEDSILIGDINHSDVAQPLSSDYYPHRGIGLRLSGQIFTQVKAGTWNIPEWWTPKQDLEGSK